MFKSSAMLYNTKIIPLFIKNTNANIPLCNKCVHFVEHKIYYKSSSEIAPEDVFSRCKMFCKQSAITGRVVSNSYAAWCRDDKTMCGINGKYYEGK